VPTGPEQEVVELQVQHNHDADNYPPLDKVDVEPDGIRREPAPSPNVAVSQHRQTDGGQQGGKKPRQRPEREDVGLDPRRRLLVIGEDEVGADGDGQDPIVGLQDEQLRHEAVEAAKPGLLGSPDPAPADVEG